jgi:hypothetical protein
VRAQRKAFVVERGHLPARLKRDESQPIIVEAVDPKLADQKRRDRRL